MNKKTNINRLIPTYLSYRLVALVLFFFTLNFSFAQPFTTANRTNMSAESAMTLCTGSTYYFSALIAPYDYGNIGIFDNGLRIGSAAAAGSWTFGSNCTEIEGAGGKSARSGTYGGTGGGVTIYFVINGTTNTVYTTTTAPTCSSIPTVSTTSSASVSCTSENLTGEVTANGGAAITERGFIHYVGGADDREIGDAGVTKISEADADIESFTLLASSLPGSTAHKYRAFATNSVGTAYGSQLTFTTAACSAPTVAATVAASTIGCFTADPGGNVTSDGGATITERGLVYSTSSNPTTADTKVIQAGTTGAWTGSLIGLTVSTLYYVRAYATNSVGTSYGTQTSFTTSGACSAPTVAATVAAGTVTCTTSDPGGNVTSDGGDAITERGLVYATTANPTTADTKVVQAGTTGSWTGSLTGLVGNTTYYVRAFATNGVGTTYGTQTSFTTSWPCLPVVPTTDVASVITGNSATSGGEVTSNNGYVLSASGVVWNTAGTPTLGSNLGSTDEGTSVSTFVSNLTGLTPSTTYYVRSYATNANGTTYGPQISFMTAALSLPTVEATVDETFYSCNDANPGGNVTSDGGSAITERGLVYGTSSNPTTADTKSVQAGTTGSWTGYLSGLSASTTYYVRAYATNAVGTSYGAEISFTTDATCPTFMTSGTSTNWDDASAWVGGVVPTTSWTNSTVGIRHNVTKTGDLTNLNATALSGSYIRGPVTWSITGNMTNNGYQWETSGGGTISVGGTMTVNGSSSIISGDVNLSFGIGTFTDNSAVTTSGSTTATTSLTTLGSSVYTSSGAVTIPDFNVAGASTFNNTGGNISVTTFDVTSDGLANISGGNFNASGNVGVTGSKGLSVSAASNFTILGNYTNTGSVSTTFSGDFTLTGDFSIAGSSPTTFAGTAIIYGDAQSTSSASNITVTGTLDMKQELALGGGAVLSGTGIVGWSTLDVNGVTSNYIQCGNFAGDRHDGLTADATWPDPPGNPLDLNSCAAGVLPVELISFSASSTNEKDVLTWETASEINNELFEIYLTTDGKNWLKIGEVFGAGNSETINAYKFEWTNSEYSNTRYYKLKQIDFDGLYAFSEIVKVSDLKLVFHNVIKLYPNPTFGEISMDLSSIKSEVLNLILADVTGKVWMTIKGNVKSGKLLSYNVSNLAPGIYTVTLEAKNGVRYYGNFVKK